MTAAATAATVRTVPDSDSGTPMSVAIDAEHLTVSLGGPPVLRDVSFAVRTGESVGLFGANGSGKTTLLRTLLGLVRPESGHSSLFGTEISRFGDWKLIGYVPQRSTVAMDAATVAEVVASGRLPHRRPFVPARAADRKACAAALEQVGVAALARREFQKLSGGQQQRVLIARALAGEPELLFLDEPLAGIDLPSQQALAETLHSLNESGRTLFTVLHDAGPLADILQRRLTLVNGRLDRDEATR
ncbi:zinc transport system ATP-binding protein [Naumannella halotolerans]|uniref:Zinc transport system ATP-binding protein n=1 Tax=Naumannella halotolerans TaxID=993414 RepID=A0A4R7J8M7_9ACTN|nr:zinc transport system ATP-binding protein [Naumannella halotolerans]